MEWKAFVRHDFAGDCFEIFIRRSFGETVDFLCASDGQIVVTRRVGAELYRSDPPAFARGLDGQALAALGLAIDEALGKPEARRLLEAKAASADGAAEYAKALNERFIGILEKHIA